MASVSALQPAAIYALLALGVLLLLLYFFLLARALSPRRGTLEWISMYDRPGLQLSGAVKPLNLQLFFGLAPAALSIVLYFFVSCLKAGTFQLFADPLDFMSLLTNAVIHALTAAGGFCLLHSLWGSLPVSLCGALLLGLDWSGNGSAVCLAVWALFFLHRWACTDFELPAVDSLGPLAAFELCMVLSVRVAPSTVPMAIALGLLLLSVLFLRFHGMHRADRGRQLAVTLIFAVLCFYLLLAITHLFLQLLNGAGIRVLLTGSFYLHALTSWCPGLSLTLPDLLSTANPLLLLAGLGCTAFSIFTAWRYGNSEGFFLGFFAVGAFAAWLLTGGALLPAILIPAVCFSFYHFLRRGFPWIAICGIVFSFAMVILTDLTLLSIL